MCPAKEDRRGKGVGTFDKCDVIERVYISKQHIYNKYKKL